MRTVVLALAFLFGFLSIAECQELNFKTVKERDIYFNKVADAIFRAEGGYKTKHPYGILKKYKKTSPRQACLNTIRSKYLAWKSIEGPKAPFLEYLASKYAPIGVANDPTNLNKNWLNNVRYFMAKNV